MEQPEKYNMQKSCSIQTQLKNNKGFTLIEVFIVIMIIMICVAIVIPQVEEYKKNNPRTKTEQIQKEVPAPIQNNAEEKSGNSL